MKKTLVIYWSGTGNTEAMAGAVLEGMKAAGADAALLTPDQVTPASLSGVSSVAMGCPAMGSEVLEEMEFQPMFDSIKNQMGGKAVGLFGSFGWAMASGCAAGRRTATTRASTGCATASPAARPRTTKCWRPARPWAASWRSKSPMKLRRMLRRKLLFWAAVAALTLLAAVYQEYI